MSKSVYDIFRAVQDKRTTCYDNRSAAFIEQGKMAKTIYHVRLNNEIKAGLVFQHKEGPDEVLVYTYIKDDLQKSDYFVYESINYLIYEEYKNTDEEVNYKKQRAVECNVSFTFNNLIYKGYFTSSIRRSENSSFEGRQLIMPDENPLLILPTNNYITINSKFLIEGKPWKIVEFDSITNKGISYYYLERDYTKKTTNIEEELNETILDETSLIEQTTTEEEIVILGGTEEDTREILKAMVEYTFATEEAFFSSTPTVQIISRKKTEVKFKIPFGISEVSISTKSNGSIIEKSYKVVL